VLQGGGTPAQRDVVALNTALVLWAAGEVASVAEGYLDAARDALAAGLGWQKLEQLRQALPQPAAG
jgi:anthranilate phosphoribosyltransferase